MTKTRSQALGPTVKKEEHEDKPELEQMLHSTNNASKSKNKITKNRKHIRTQNAQVKSKNVDDNSGIQALSKRIFARSKFTAEHITRLIKYIVNDKMNLKVAAKKVGMNEVTAQRYYHEYQDDPEHKIPATKIGYYKQPPTISQQKIDDLIDYIVNDRMSLTQASKKADINRKLAARYYAKYLEDPERKIPLLGNSSKRCTQEEISKLIRYIVHDKMSVSKASRIVNMTQRTARRYYLQYLQSPNYEIPDPRQNNQRNGKRCTNDQVSSLIGYILEDGMTLLEASVKANMSRCSARKYYKQYLNDPEKNIPTPENNNSRVSNNPPAVDQIKDFFCYLIVDKLSVAQAAQKAKITRSSGQTYYNKYLKNPTREVEIKDMSYSVEKMKRLVELVQNEKMSLKRAAEEVDLNVTSARKYYQKYLKDPQHEFPAIKSKQYTQEDIKKLIDYIEGDKMSIYSAARKIKMGQTSASKYYTMYQNDPQHRIPAPNIRGHKTRNKTFDTYTQIIADIYKNNPLIKPVHGIYHPELDTLDIEIKEETTEDDTKMPLIAQNN